jgi:16S rRNA C967 or C1407 C5-methylase (RsmB/RsmF family)
MTLADVLPAEEHTAFQSSLHQFGRRSIRLRVDRADVDLPFETTIVPWFSGGRFLVDSDIRPSAFLNYAVADYYIQDAASMLPLNLLNLQPGDIVCDLCAAPGGKASAIAELLGQDGFLLANEPVRSRLDILKYALAKTGVPNHAVCSYDPDELASRLPGQFDAVLVDAPCSGQTLVGRNKRDENAFAENQIEHCALRQKRILRAAMRLLKSTGRVVYSTCTFAVEENEAQIQWLLEEYPNALVPIEPQELQAWRSPMLSGCYRVWPHRDHCAGGFAAGLQLTQEIDHEPHPLEVKGSHSKGKTKSKAVAEGRSSKVNQQQAKQKMEQGIALLNSLGNLQDVKLDWESGMAFGLTPHSHQNISRFRSITAQSLSLMVETGNHWIPSHGLGLLLERYFASIQSQHLTVGQATDFLNGKILTDSECVAAMQAGWVLAKWDGKPLGWMKGAANRFNNHLPPWARWNSTGSY